MVSWEIMKRVLGYAVSAVEERGQLGKREALLFRGRSLCNRRGFLYDPGPKGPAFSATSRASFKF